MIYELVLIHLRKKMKKIFLTVIVLRFFTMEVLPQEKILKIPQIEFTPKNYICYRTDEKINIDGKLDEKSWAQTGWTDDFVDIEGNSKLQPRYKTHVKMLWDDQYFYVAAELEEPNLWATLTQRDTVIFYDNDFEIFIDPDGDTHNYYELELNALKTVWDLFLVRPYRDYGGKQVPFVSWDIKGLQVGVHLDGTLNNPNDKDNGWTCEIAIPWAVLKESFYHDSTPKPGEQWRVNFSRVEWNLENVNGLYKKKIDPATNKPYTEDNWVWSPHGLINIHYPELWGFVLLSGKTAGTEKDTFEMKRVEYAKWLLRKIYYNEKIYYFNHNKYTTDLSLLNTTDLKTDDYILPPVIEATTNLFEARLTSKDGNEIVSIKNDGEISIIKKIK
jgi:hypothetical protein